MSLLNNSSPGFLDLIDTLRSESVNSSVISRFVDLLATIQPESFCISSQSTVLNILEEMKSESVSLSSQLRVMTPRESIEDFVRKINMMPYIVSQKCQKILTEKLQYYTKSLAANGEQRSNFPPFILNLAREEKIDLDNLENSNNQNVERFCDKLQNEKKVIQSWLNRFMHEAEQSLYLIMNNESRRSRLSVFNPQTVFYRKNLQVELRKIELENEKLKESTFALNKKIKTLDVSSSLQDTSYYLSDQLNGDSYAEKFKEYLLQKNNRVNLPQPDIKLKDEPKAEKPINVIHECKNLLKSNKDLSGKFQMESKEKEKISQDLQEVKRKKDQIMRENEAERRAKEKIKQDLEFEKRQKILLMEKNDEERREKNRLMREKHAESREKEIIFRQLQEEKRKKQLVMRENEKISEEYFSVAREKERATMEKEQMSESYQQIKREKEFETMQKEQISERYQQEKREKELAISELENTQALTIGTLGLGLVTTVASLLTGL